jgi:hypothetical protein
MSSSKAVFLEEKRRKMLVFGVHHQEKCSTVWMRGASVNI